MRLLTRQSVWAACLTAVSLSICPLFSYADDPAPNTAKPATAPEALKPQAPVKPASQLLDTVEVDPSAPVIPLAAVKTLDTSNMTLDQAKESLRSLMEAQQKMMSQMQVLQARIEKTEVTTQANQQAIEANSQQQQDTLSAMAKKVHLGGYVETGWRIYSHGPRTDEYLDAGNRGSNTFDVRRVVLQPRVQFTEKASWYGEVEFEDAGLDEISVEESLFNYAFKPWLNVHTGLMILPYTYTALNHAGYQRLLVDRPLLDNFIIPSTYRDAGIGLTGTVPVMKRGALSYEFDVVNGLTDTIAPDDVVNDASNGLYRRLSSSVDFEGLRSARPNEGIANTRFRDNNSNKMLFGRLGFSPIPNLQIGVSASNGRIDPGNRNSLNIVASDIYYRLNKFSLLGEAATDLFGHKSNNSSQGISFRNFPQGMNGYFLQAAYDVTPKMTAVTAYNYVNLDTGHSGNSMQRFSLGMRYNPINNVFLKAEYQFTTPRGQFGSEERRSNALLTQLTFFFL